MAYVVGDLYYREFTTSNPTTGAAANADVLPVATANRNGTDDSGFVLTVTNLDTGRYKITGTIPATYAAEDVINISVTATVGGVTGKDVVDLFFVATGYGTISSPTITLTSLSALKAYLGITGTGQDTLLNQILGHVQSCIEKYCKRTFAQAGYTEYYSGNGNRDVVLRQRPVTSVANVWLDAGGYFGLGTNSPFAATTLLTQGGDYVLIYGAGGESGAGLLRRIGAIASSQPMGWTNQERIAGPLAARALPYWPVGTGNIKVQYTGGYSTIPADLQAAANQLAAWMRNNGPRGAQLAGESLGAYSYSMVQSSVELGTVRQILSRYREFAIG